MSDLGYLEKLLEGVDVEWKRLGDVVNMRAGQHISASKITGEASSAHPYPCFGGNGIRGFVAKNSHNGRHLLIGRQGALCGNVQRTSGQFYATEHAVVVTPSDYINVDWAFHLLTLMNLNQYASKSAQPGLAVGKIESLKIPIPCPDNPKKSLAIQSEIVRILDTFTALTAELTAELTARKKQYNYYRDQLLSFEEGEVEWKTLGEITTRIASGRNKAREKEGQFSVYGSTGLIGFTDEPAYSGDLLLVARVGAYAGLVNAVSGHFDVSDNTLIVQPADSWNVRFAFHQLTYMNLNQFAVGAGQPLVTGGLLKNLKVPLPSINDQNRIATILDKFETLTKSITDGLPREIELRQKQYEYYRDLLFSFPKPDAFSQ